MNREPAGPVAVLTNPRQPRLQVLIVDDAPQVRQELRFLLQLASELDVVGEAGDGVQAIAQAEALRPHVIVLDVEMPGLDGCAVAAAIKACNPACHIIALTIHGDAATRQAARRAGVDEFIEKGAPLAALLRAIELHDQALIAQAAAPARHVAVNTQAEHGRNTSDL